MTTIEKLRTLARELAGEAWDYERRRLCAQARVRRDAARAVMEQADAIQREDAMFEDPPAGYGSTQVSGRSPRDTVAEHQLVTVSRGRGSSLRSGSTPQPTIWSL